MRAGVDRLRLRLPMKRRNQRSPAPTRARMTVATKSVLSAIEPVGRKPHLVRVAGAVPAPIWTQPAASGGEPMTTDRARATPRLPDELDADVEAALIGTLTRALAPGESHRTGNDNKERELYALLARLDLQQASALGRRLDADVASDQLVAAFRRLVTDRRQRIRAFVRDARRRGITKAA